MLGEATLDVLGTFLGEAIRFLIPSVAQHLKAARQTSPDYSCPSFHPGVKDLLKF